MEKTLVTIMSCSDKDNLNFIKNLLEENDIQTFITNENALNGEIPTDCKINIRADKTEKAVKLILELYKDCKTRGQEKINIIKRAKIMVPVDLSERSLNAGIYAVNIAEKVSAEINFIYVYEDPLSGSHKSTSSWQEHAKYVAEEAENKAKEELLEFSNKLNADLPKEKRKNAKINFSLQKGDPRKTIVKYSNTFTPDLIVMGCRGEAKNKEMVGEVITEVISKTYRPVLTVPKSAKYPEKKINVMYATNFNDADNSSIEELLKILKPYDKKIHCIHIDKDLEQNNYKEEKLNNLNKFIKTNFPTEDVECNMLKNSNLLKAFESFIEEKNIDIISFSSPKRSIIYKIFNPNNLKKMVLSSKNTMLIFPVP